MSKLVRIYPTNPARGYTVQSYLLSGSPYPMFRVERGWYEVDNETAKRLAKIRQNDNDDYSRPVFQVCNREEAIAVEEAEDSRRAAAEDPVPLPTRGIARKAASFKSKGVEREERAKVKKRRHLANLRDDDDAGSGATDEDFDEAFDDEEDLAPPSRDLTTADLEDRPRKAKKHRPVEGTRKGSALSPVRAGEAKKLKKIRA